MFFVSDIAIVGGGFGAGIHNVLEPAAFGVPVLFGPNHTKYQEAQDLIAQGGGSFINGHQLRTVVMAP